MSKQPCVYILASGRIGTIYIGVTADLLARVYQHRTSSVPGFTSRYGVVRLVRFEMFADMPAAIARGETAEALASRVENEPDRIGQSRLERFGDRPGTSSGIEARLPGGP